MLFLVETQRLLGAIDSLLFDLDVAPQIEQEDESRHLHDWIPLELQLFVPFLAAAMKAAPRKPARFLDVGAGLGTKLLFAQHLYGPDIECRGIELRPEYVEVAQRRGLVVEQADAFAWDGYAAADVVYMYRPCIEGELQRQLEAHVASQMSAGAVLIVVSGELSFPGWRVLLNYGAGPFVGVWQKPEGA